MGQGPTYHDKVSSRIGVTLLELDVDYVVALDVVKVYLLELVVHGHDEVREHHALVAELERVPSHSHDALQERPQLSYLDKSTGLTGVVTCMH